MNYNIEDLKQKAKELRINVLDLGIKEGESHFGGAFSMIEIIISLYNNILTSQDKFILSKGHCCYPFYLLLKEKGFNPKLTGHPDIDVDNGIVCTTGSLGHGMPIAVGMAMARKKQNKPGKIYVLISDGECQEGTIWESSLIANYHKLTNLVVIVDNNKIQALDKIKDVSSLDNLSEKFKSFGYSVSEIDGHNFFEIIDILQLSHSEKPRLIIAHTTKGKGLSFMENDPKWHTRFPTTSELDQAYKELK